MPDWVYVSDIARHQGQEVMLKGWLYNKRSSGKLHFLQIRDGTGIIQCVVSKKDVPEAAFDAAGKAHQEASVIVRGTVKADARSALGFELHVKDLTVLQGEAGYPIQPKD